MLWLVRLLAKRLGYEILTTEELGKLRQLDKGGECRYALIAIDGGNPAKYWPIDINDVIAGKIEPRLVPDDWRAYLTDLSEARVVIVPKFLAERIAAEGSLQMIGIDTPITIETAALTRD